jgi:hypothetical protein
MKINCEWREQNNLSLFPIIMCDYDQKRCHKYHFKSRDRISPLINRRFLLNFYKMRRDMRHTHGRNESA